MNVLEIIVDDIKFYPSVTYDYVNITIKGYSGSVQTEIYALSGDFISVQSGNKLSFKKFKSGIYFCLVSFAGKKKTLKVVKL